MPTQRAMIDVKHLRSAVADGRTLTSITAELGVGRATVSRAASAAGIVVPKRPPPITQRSPHPQLDDAEWLADAYAKRTTPDIANELSVSHSTVSAALHRHGITPRSGAARRTILRPAPLNDPLWLRNRYQDATGTVIADELGGNPQMVWAALRDHGLERRDRSDRQRFRSPPELADGDWLLRGSVKCPALSSRTSSA